MPRVLGVLVALLALSAAHAQTLYRSVGPDGRVVYSDKPPADGRVEKTLKFENLPASDVPAGTLSYVEQLRRMKAAEPPAVQAQGVVLYAASWCGYCRKARAYLANKGIAYQEIDIDTETGKRAFAQAGGGRGVPLLVANGQRVQGFDSRAYDTVLAAR